MNVSEIQGIAPIWSVFPGEETKNVKEAGAGGAFTEIFQSAIDNVKQTDADYNEMQYLLATGQLDNPAEVTMAGTLAQASVELLIQMRNKALEAYSELMRISI